MAEDCIFLASGDACPLCAGLNGQPVSAGYQPHPGCHCQTVKRPESGCSRHVSGPNFIKVGDRVMAGFEVEIRCPDGSTNSSSGMITETPDFGNDGEFYGAVWEAIEELGDELCESCDGHEDPLIV